MSLDLDCFKVFNAVVSCGSFGKASEQLNCAQSVVSYQIHKLEQNLGTLLFDRNAYRASLTQAGQALLSESKRLLQQYQHIQNLAQHYTHGWEPALEIVIDGALPMDPVMLALKSLAEQNIPTKIQVKVEFLGGVQKRFLSDSADLMLVKDFLASPGLIAQPLPDIDNLLVVSKDHPLAKQTNIERRVLLEQVELTVNDSSSSALDINDAHQFGGDRVFYLSGFVYKKNALLMGLGFGWMPKFLIEQELRDGSLVPVDYAQTNHYRFSPKLVQSEFKPLGKAGEKLKLLILKEFDEYLTTSN